MANGAIDKSTSDFEAALRYVQERLPYVIQKRSINGQWVTIPFYGKTKETRAGNIIGKSAAFAEKAKLEEHFRSTGQKIELRVLQRNEADKFAEGWKAHLLASPPGKDSEEAA